MAKETLSYSRISTYLQCRLKYKFRYVEKLSPKVKSPKLSLGSIIHEALEQFYNGYIKTKEQFLAYYDNWWKTQEAEIEEKFPDFSLDEKLIKKKDKAKDIGRIMLDGYWDRYAIDDKKFYKILLAEKEFIIPIRNPKTNYRSRYFDFKLKIDGLFREKRNDNLWLFETKTAKSWDEDVNFLQRDDQMLLYLLGLQTVLKKKLAGTLYNVLIKGKPSNRRKSPLFYRNKVYRGKLEIDAMKQQIWDLSEEIHKNKLYPRNIGLHCMWMCPYESLCNLEAEELKEAFFEKRK